MCTNNRNVLPLALILAVLIGMNSPIAWGADPETSKNQGTRWAVLIGVNDYTELKDLRFAGSDMRELKRRLIGLGFPEEQVFLLHDKAEKSQYRPFRTNVEKQLELVLSLAEEDDLVTVAFSGHGVHLDGKSYLCPSESQLKKPAETMVALDAVYARLSNCKAALKLMLVDACRNDPRVEGQRNATTKIEAAGFTRPPQGVLLLSSCDANQTSYEHKDLGHGVFMHSLLEGLSGKADSENGNRDGRVSLLELFNYSNRRTKTYVARTFNDFQTPKLRGELTGDFDISRVLARSELPKITPSVKPSGKFVTNSIGMKLVLIPAGEFSMGSSKSAAEIARKFKGKAEYYKDEHPQHRVGLSKSFYMQTMEVTQGQWQAVMGTTPWKGKAYAKAGADYAANYVSWEDATEYCRKLSTEEGRQYRLPTEAEWEYTCRAGTTTLYSFGADASALQDYALFDDNAYDVDEKYAHKVGLERPNAWGLYDMHGNVWEWCADWHGADYYAKSPIVDPSGPSSGSFRVLRGGCWGCNAQGCRSACRNRSTPACRSSGLGFRVVCELD